MSLQHYVDLSQQYVAMNAGNFNQNSNDYTSLLRPPQEHAPSINDAEHNQNRPHSAVPAYLRMKLISGSDELNRRDIVGVVNNPDYGRSFYASEL